MATLLRHPPPVDLAQFRPGLVLGGKYQVVKEIGRGGLGATFHCTHIGTGQDVAVKVLALPPGENDTVFRRFFLEARACAGLGHPNTLRFFDFGQDASGACYLVTELLDGRTLAEELRERLRRGEVFTELEALGIGDAILRSLTEAHDKGVIHRDIKPANIFLHNVQGDQPVIKVLDFGIAHSTELAAQGPLTAGSPIAGTPAYMSPEQVLGQPLDGRSDLYAVGAVLYELVTGNPPFVGETPVATAYQQVNAPLTPLFELARTTVSTAFMDAVEKALSKSPSGRWADAATMRHALFGKRGRVTGSQLSVRVSSSSIPMVSVTDGAGNQSIAQITVNGEAVDAGSLQPPASARGRLVDPAGPAQEHAQRQRIAWGLTILALVIAAVLLVTYGPEVVARDADPAVHPDPTLRTQPGPPRKAPASDAPLPGPPSTVSPSGTDAPTEPPEPMIPPPPPVGMIPAGAKRMGCDPLDPECK